MSFTHTCLHRKKVTILQKAIQSGTVHDWKRKMHNKSGTLECGSAQAGFDKRKSGDTRPVGTKVALSVGEKVIDCKSHF